jgi:hypothetical protein
MLNILQQKMGVHGGVYGNALVTHFQYGQAFFAARRFENDAVPLG